MQIALSILGGAVWGLLAALLNATLMKRAVSKNDIKSVSLCNMLRFFIDAGALAIVFLMRRYAPSDASARTLAIYVFFLELMLSILINAYLL